MAVLGVRVNICGVKQHAPADVDSDPDAIASFIAAVVPLYEYSESSSVSARLLTQCNPKGLFRNGGRELHFLDGSPAKRCLAVQVDDVGCVIAMLKEPQRASAIRRMYVKRAASQLRDHTRRLRTEFLALRSKFEALRNQAAGGH